MPVTAYVRVIRRENSGSPYRADQTQVKPYPGSPDLGCPKVELLYLPNRALLDPAIQRARLAVQKSRGRPPRMFAEFVVQGAPPYAMDRPWFPPDLHAWADRVIMWLLKCCGSKSIPVWGFLFHGGRAPYLRFLMFVADAQGRPGFDRVSSGFGRSGRETGLHLMSVLQQRYAAECGLPPYMCVPVPRRRPAAEQLARMQKTVAIARAQVEKLTVDRDQLAVLLAAAQAEIARLRQLVPVEHRVAPTSSSPAS